MDTVPDEGELGTIYLPVQHIFTIKNEFVCDNIRYCVIFIDNVCILCLF